MNQFNDLIVAGLHELIDMGQTNFNELAETSSIGLTFVHTSLCLLTQKLRGIIFLQLAIGIKHNISIV